MRIVFVSLALVALLGCDFTVQVGATDGGALPDGGAGRTECLAGLSRADWYLVKQVAQGVLQDALQVSEESAKPAPGGKVMVWGALSVPFGNGLWQDSLGFGVSIDGLKTCDASIWCSPPRSPMTGVRFCAKSACEGVRGAVMTVAMTDPSLMTTGSTHPLSYTAQIDPPTWTDAGLRFDGPSGDVRTLRYPSNPSMDWHLQHGTTAGVEVTGAPSFTLTATDAEGRVLDLSSSGTVVVNLPTAGDVPVEVTGVLRMPNVTGGALDVDWHLDANNQLVGAVKRGGTSLGSFSMPIAQSLKVPFARWLSACD